MIKTDNLKKVILLLYKNYYNWYTINVGTPYSKIVVIITLKLNLNKTNYYTLLEIRGVFLHLNIMKIIGGVADD